MFRSGTFVAAHVDPTDDEQVQPNGVDLTLDAVLEQREPGRIARDGKEIGTRQERQIEESVAPSVPENLRFSGSREAQLRDDSSKRSPNVSRSRSDEDASRTTERPSGRSPRGGEEGDAYYLTRGGYVVRYAERVRIPEGHVGFIYPRSSLMRNSCMVNTAVWDAGYEGKGEGLLQVHHDVEIERGARIAQLVLAEAGHETTYDGSYQGENLE